MNLYLGVNLIGAFQAWLVFGALFYQFRSNQKINRAFLALIFSIAVSLTSKLFFNANTFAAAPRFWYFLDTAVFLFLPLWYKVLLTGLGKEDNSILSKIMLSGALFQSIFLIATIQLTTQEMIRYNSAFSFFGFLITLALSGSYFLFRSWKLIQSTEEFVIPKGVRLGQLALSTLMLLGIVITIYAVLNEYSINQLLILYNWLILALSFTMVILGAALTIFPKDFALITLPFPSKKVDSLEHIADKIASLVEHDKKFLQPKLSLQEVANAIETNPVITSKAINQVIGLSFPDYVNQLRVAHFIKLAKNARNREFTHWALAQEAGFGNKVSFYKSFKKVHKKTPKEYLEKPQYT